MAEKIKVTVDESGPMHFGVVATYRTEVYASKLDKGCRDWFYVETDAYEGCAMIEMECLTPLIKTLQKLRKNLRDAGQLRTWRGPV